MRWGKRNTEQYRNTVRIYNRTYHKTLEYKKKRRECQRTKAGRIYKLRAALTRIKRHKYLIDTIKLKKGCEICGFNKWPECLDFDHKNPKKKLFNISQKLMWSMKNLQKEINKCRVLCANCHRHHSKNTHWRKHAS